MKDKQAREYRSLLYITRRPSHCPKCILPAEKSQDTPCHVLEPEVIISEGSVQVYDDDSQESRADDSGNDVDDETESATMVTSPQPLPKGE